MPEDADILAGLHGIRLPGAEVADLLLAVALGLAAAGLVTALALAALRARPGRMSGADRLEAARALPGPERAVALVRLLREAGRPLPDGAAEALYRPGPGPDLDALERAAARALAR